MKGGNVFAQQSGFWKWRFRPVATSNAGIDPQGATMSFAHAEYPSASVSASVASLELASHPSDIDPDSAPDTDRAWRT